MAVLSDLLIFCFILFQIHDLPLPSFMNKTLEDLDIGTYENIATVGIIQVVYENNRRTLTY